MCPGLSDDISQITDSRKTAIIDSELCRLDIDIAALQETRLAADGMMREKNYTFFWKGKASEEPRIHGVGFAIKNSLLQMIAPPTGGSERILSLTLSTSSGKVNILSIYAPTLCSPQETKDQFYENLDSEIRKIPVSEHIVLLGDFNARVGSDHDSWSENLGHFGIGKMNENGQRLLELCSYHKLCITNTFFKSRPSHKVSWKHPRSGHWHQLDLIITRKAALNSVSVTRSYHSADCDTDHSLVCTRMCFNPQKIHHTKQKGRPRINFNSAVNPEIHDNFIDQLTAALTQDNSAPSAEDSWKYIRDTIYDTAMSTLGRQEKKNQDWFEANLSVMEPVITAKRNALIKYKQAPSQKNLAALRTARNTAQKTARQCANSYWQDLCNNIQVCADTGNVHGMYQGMKKAFGPTARKIAPLMSKDGEPITDRAKQMERWAEHYQTLYSTESTVTEPALASVPVLPVIDELDQPPSTEELSRAIDKLAHGKAPGQDSIPAEVLQLGKPVLLSHLHSLLIQCWEEGSVPQDMRDASIMTLYKNKGDRSDCNNYRGISLLSTTGKAFARVVLKRLQVLAERVYPESQCGFRAERSTVDMLFSLRQLQEKSREQKQPLYLAFIDLTKAFDLVSRKGLFSLLQRIGCPPKLLSIIISFHDGMMGTVNFDGSSSEPFPIKSGVKQGCVLAPTLFGIFFSLVLSSAFKTSEDGVYIHTRSDGKLFNLARLKAKTKVRKVLIRELLFADDAALVSHSQQGLQSLVNSLAQACKGFGLTISLKKTEIMGQDVSEAPTININDYTLKVVEEFTYLGSTVSQNSSLEPELNKRIGKASAVMSKLSKRVWENNKLTTETKMAVYKACVLSTLLYGSEAWPCYKQQESRLNCFHMRCLRRILGITWKDRVSNNDVLTRSHIPSMFGLLSQRRLRWLGHVSRMEDGRIPKDMLYGQLATGTRSAGRPLLRFKDVCKRDMKAANINTDTWEDAAANRCSWRQSVIRGICTAEEKLSNQWAEKRIKRKAAETNAYQPSSYVCPKCHKDCHSKIGLYSHKRSCKK